MPRWLEPTIDAKASTTQNVDFYGAMNRFYRNVRDPASTLTQASPWQLLYSAWDQLSYQFSAQSGFAAADAVIGADILNEPYISYVGGEPPAGQSVLQAAGNRLITFYDALAPAITNHAPTWLLFFQDSTGGYNAANPAARETPTMTRKPNVPGNWVYSLHDYNFSYGTFADGVTRHDDFGITVMNAALANADRVARAAVHRRVHDVRTRRRRQAAHRRRHGRDQRVPRVGADEPGQLVVLGVRQPVHADDRDRRQHQPGDPGGASLARDRARPGDHQPAPGRHVHERMHRARVHVRRPGVHRPRRHDRELRLDLR